MPQELESISTHADVFVSELLLKIAQSLVDDSDSVRVTCVYEDRLTTLKLEVATSDVGKIIGKQGRTARSLRTILSAAGKKYDSRYVLDISDSPQLISEVT